MPSWCITLLHVLRTVVHRSEIYAHDVELDRGIWHQPAAPSTGCSTGRAFLDQKATSLSKSIGKLLTLQNVVRVQERKAFPCVHAEALSTDSMSTKCQVRNNDFALQKGLAGETVLLQSIRWCTSFRERRRTKKKHP